MIRAAREWGITPSALLRLPDADRRAILALQAIEGDVHGPCGQPAEIAFHPDMDGGYEVRSMTCHACAALEGERNSERKIEPGEMQYLVQMYDPIKKVDIGEDSVQ